VTTVNTREYFNNCNTFIDNMITAKESILQSIRSNEVRREAISKKADALTEAKHIISAEISEIQSSLKEDIDSLVSIALGIVYEDRDVKFSMAFEKTKAGQSQYRPTIVENGEEFNPKDEQCGGALDIISYALRIILHSFERPKGRQFMFFDEPFKFLGGGILGEKAAEMARKINADIGLQTVIISHDEISIAKADKVYHIDHNGKKSTAKLIGEEKPKSRRVRI
jgi:DNA repair exonuclease SbcCD ATPase subunit